MTVAVRRGAKGREVTHVQRRLRRVETGEYDEDTEAAVRGFQKLAGIPPTGEVDEETLGALGPPATAGQVPAWYARPLTLGLLGDDVAWVRHLLGLRQDDQFDPLLEAAVRRFQSAHRLPLTGVVDEATAIEIGD